MYAFMLIAIEINHVINTLGRDGNVNPIINTIGRDVNVNPIINTMGRDINASPIINTIGRDVDIGLVIAAIMPSQASFITTFHKSCGGDLGIWTTTCYDAAD